jgi:hypothetical protein
VLFTSDRGQPEIDAGAAEPRPNPRGFRIMLLAGAYFVAGGLFLQWYLAPAALACGQRRAAAATCVVRHHMLLGLVPAGTEPLSGVRAARMDITRSLRERHRSTYHVVLETAGGEHTLASSRSLEAAHGLAGTINQRLQAGQPFEAALEFAFLDWALRTSGLVLIAGGIVFAARGLWGLQRR